MKITIKDKNYSATINPLGAELESFYKDSINYIWTIDEQYWNKTSPVLFPIVGRLKNDLYTLNGKEYSLPRHGFARNFEFNILENTSNSVLFSLKSNEETLEVYPFEFELQLEYSLNQNELKISYKVFNYSNQKMPFNIGAHPAFSIPSDFEEYSLQFNENELFKTHHLENELFNGKSTLVDSNNNIIKLKYSLFEKDALVFKNLQSNEVSILRNNKNYIIVNFEGFHYLGIWTKVNAPFLCIEPWMGHADYDNTNREILEKKSIQILNPESTFECNFNIKIV
jgi:galactose mutarotase-like enzyme